MNSYKQYERCMVMAGGGFRFGIYLGMYAALRDNGRAPDVLLASCGGAMAAAIIHNLPDDASRRAWLTSPDMHRFWCGLKSTPQARLLPNLLSATRRKLSRARAAVVPDLFEDYLFEIPAELPFPPQTGTPEVDVAILGGQLLFGPEDVGRKRGQRKLYAETLFGNARSRALVEGMHSPVSDPHWGSHAVEQNIRTNGDVPLTDAARISVADMFYFRCQAYGGQEYIGGVVDLFPVEVARRLARQLVMERKEEFDQTFAIPAWRAVLGIDGNRRLRFANSEPVEVRIDASDVSHVLARQQLQQKLDWRRNRIELAMPPDYATFVRYMDDQWDYGYNRATQACRQAAHELA